MGILNQKLKKQLQSCNVTPLRNHYTQVQPRCYESTQTSFRLISTSLVLQNSQVEPFLNCLKFRTKHPQILVQIQHAEIKKQQIDYCKLLLFIENISLNLQQLMSIHFRDMLSILYFSIPAFCQLLKFHGRYFTIESYMIGINDQGKVKVWSNRDYTKHQTKVCYSFAKSGSKEQAEQNMVKELKTLFFCKVAKNSISRDFNLQSNSFSGLLGQLENKFGKEMLVNNFLNLIKLKQPDQSSKLQSGSMSQRGSSRVAVSQDGKAPLIRFNYEADKSTILASTNSNSMVNSISKVNQNISFNYSNNNQATSLQTSQVQRIY